MAITVTASRNEGARWTVELAVEEGVYRLDSYPVRVREVPEPPPDWSEAAVKEAVERFALEEARRHIWQGALPPHGMEVAAPDLFRR